MPDSRPLSAARCTLIAALSQNRVIGNRNHIPWHIPDDFRHFKNTTMGHPVIMGRKTFDSIGGKPLPGRPHFIITRTPQEPGDNVTFVSSLEAAIAQAGQLDDEIFICGGAQIYEAALPRCNRMILTHIARMVAFDPAQWTTTEWSRSETPEPYSIVEYNRI
jgi:dihydrofolate reductase